MRNTRRLGGLAVAAILAVASANAAVTVDFVPAVQTTTVGSTVSYDIIATVTDPILGWGLDLSIDDPSVASLTGITIDPLWNGAASNPDGDGLTGVVAFPPVGVTGTFTLATIDLLADAIGSTTLTLSATAGDLTEGFALDPTGFDADVVFKQGTLNVIPEPTALSLLVLGGLLAIRRR
jgi:hypothetical protein